MNWITNIPPAAIVTIAIVCAGAWIAFYHLGRTIYQHGYEAGLLEGARERIDSNAKAMQTGLAMGRKLEVANRAKLVRFDLAPKSNRKLGCQFCGPDFVWGSTCPHTKDGMHPGMFFEAPDPHHIADVLALNARCDEVLGGLDQFQSDLRNPNPTKP